MIAFFPSREILITINSWSVHWYGVFYVMAFGWGWWLLTKLQKYRDLHLTQADWLEVVVWVAAGVLVGGRLGFGILYEPLYFWHHPGEIFYLWQGGMSSHGGVVGVTVAVYLVSRMMGSRWSLMVERDRSKWWQGWLGERERRIFWQLLDVMMVPAAIGMALGRVGNIINQ